jgi:hypothetical protein
MYNLASLQILCEIAANTAGGGGGGGGNVNLTQVGGAAYALGAAATAASIPVTIATDQSWSGATNLGKAEDTAHTTGDVGVMALAVRNDTVSALAANGDYIPLTTDSSGRLRTIVSGPIDNGNAVSSSPPVLIGTMAATSNPGGIAHGQMVRTLSDLIGRPVVTLHGLPENTFTGVSAADIVDTTSTQVVAAGGVGIRRYISAISVSNMHATVATRVDILDGATVVWTGPAAANGGGYTITFPQQIRCSANTAINAQCGTTGAAVRVAISGTNSAQ